MSEPEPLAGAGLRSAQVARLLAGRISSGRIPSGEALPPERELAGQLGVSRTTLRRALADLAAAGLVERHQGRGTFAAGDRLSEEANALTSLTELGASRGLVASARVLELRVTEADDADSERFGIAPGAPVVLLHRLRRLDGLPVSLDRTRVPREALPDLGTLDFRRDSLYAALDQAGRGPVRADYTVEAVPADPAQARLLEVAPGTPLLQASTVSRDAAGRVVEAGETLYRGDRYRFRAQLVRHR
ncbi:MAG TPA: GntR family transcriptional regulator [Propionibacteriaceae bacterium]|nr:GntR family transcriptional regulator [Propionibacteriaceae bacterium]